MGFGTFWLKIGSSLEWLTGFLVSYLRYCGRSKRPPEPKPEQNRCKIRTANPQIFKRQPPRTTAHRTEETPPVLLRPPRLMWLGPESCDGSRRFPAIRMVLSLIMSALRRCIPIQRRGLSRPCGLMFIIFATSVWLNFRCLGVGVFF